jgi:hypothetical protein
MARLAMQWGDHSLVQGAEGACPAIVVAERPGLDSTQTAINYRVSWSTLGLDGALGSPSILRPATNQFVPSVSTASNGEKSTIVWSEGADDGSYSLHSLQANASGAVVTPASVLATLAQSPEPRIAKAGSGYALLWADSNTSESKLTFALLDEAGKLASTPVVVAPDARGTGSIAAIGEHFVVSYNDYQAYDSGLVSRLLFLDSKGSVLGQPIVLEDSAATGFGPTLPSLLVRGDEVLVAWSITKGSSSYENQDAATTVRLARFDADGKLQGSMFDLQAPVKNREAVQPRLIDMGEDVGLLWAEGSIIYICGGCVPNHSQKLVVLDGQSFIPQSDVTELANTFPSGGLLSSEAVRMGDELLVVSTLTYHTWGEGASGTIRCAQ